VEEGGQVKREKKKGVATSRKGATGGKKKKVSIQQSGSTTPRDTEREDVTQPAEEDLEVNTGDTGEDLEKLYCVCKTLYGEEEEERDAKG
jgi:hypothetical protein